MPNTEHTSILTSDGSVKAGPGYVYWVLVSVAATGGAWQLNDSTDDSGTDMVSGVAAANTQTFMDFSGFPIRFGTGIYADIPGSNITLTVGYA
tara:strand:- start:301 stop:579 length:279 start_codon:yes stop_codon:yes gene_type:complete